MMLRLARAIWRSFPLSARTKWHIKTGCIRWLPWAFRWSPLHRQWTALERELGAGLDSGTSAAADTPEPVALAQTSPLGASAVRLIAFYLPQFHPIPEHDRWWGKGFTEWFNVVRAKPQFPGHYQPHLPGELGFYDLRLLDIQKRQVELARLYGIGGFCFYFYWFGGKRLLERPISNYVANKELDLPFCLCWANENWSRRWDGRDETLLISQQHSDKDDLDFIRYVSNYFNDSRYIRINSRPLLIVYRPDLLPSARETANRWRAWCATNGIGQIFLAYTQSFESVEPHQHDFDAAIEFPPNNIEAPIITHKIKALNPDFRGIVYDWRIFQKRSRTYEVPPYLLFRGVCPSWDNEARRRGIGTVYLNSSPDGYEEWLFNACTETLGRVRNTDERLVFANAWNEWAEGAHLEPDSRYGYAYLAATRRALQAARYRHDRRNGGVIDPARPRISVPRQRKNRTATPIPIIIAHAFYPELLSEILDYLKRWTTEFKLWVTTSPEKADAVKHILASVALQKSKKTDIAQYTNRGRDILPFLKILDHVGPAQDEIILKIHTKKTYHRKDGALWRKELYETLLEQGNVARVLDAFKADPNLGIVAARGHLVDLEHHWGSNEDLVRALSDRMDLMYPRAKSECFPGGSMFFARYWAISPLVALRLSDSDFAPESGQKDGTAAHAVERLFGTVCHARGGTLDDTGTLGGESADGRSTPYRYAESDQYTRMLHRATNRTGS